MLATLCRVGPFPVAKTAILCLSGMTAATRLVVSKVVQKAFIEVNEEGSEAAAATAFMIELLCLPPQFVCDSPLLYLIKDNLSGLILFAGRVADPTRN